MLSLPGPPVRLLLAPAMLAGALVAAPATPEPVVAPRVVEDVRLAGIGQDIYYAITPYVQTAVGGASYLINFTPLIGAPIAAQVNILYFQGIQPGVEATVNYLAAVVQDPLDVVAATTAYGSTLFDIGYNLVSAELEFLGFDPLPPLRSSGARVSGAPEQPALRTGVTAAQRDRGRALPGGGARQSRQNAQKPLRPARFGRAKPQAVPSLGPAGQAPLAQSAERFHGKEKVNGSIPLGGSVDAGRAGGAEHMAV